MLGASNTQPTSGHSNLAFLVGGTEGGGGVGDVTEGGGGCGGWGESEAAAPGLGDAAAAAAIVVAAVGGGRVASSR